MSLYQSVELEGKLLQFEYKRPPPVRTPLPETPETVREHSTSFSGSPAFRDQFVPRDEEGRVLLDKMSRFKMDDKQVELAFPPTLPGNQRKMVHHIAHNLQLFHFSVGEGGHRYITVSKRPVMIGRKLSISGSTNIPMSRSAPVTSDFLQPIVFRSHAFRRDMPHAPPQRHSRGPDGSRGFSAGRGRPM
eukprot:TRINITY_DN11220_c0_g1_i1.p1 TRINITY_DN11220_c0_g1~~TRINITY_DN11220_c0_g1_i1.p1  ORF type:complete len:189 (+),score=24.60 TRINITY_DN11220_c0_g1_i1:351-917(+)